MNRKSTLQGTLQGGCIVTGSVAKGRAGEFAWEQQAEMRVGLAGRSPLSTKSEPGFL